MRCRTSLAVLLAAHTALAEDHGFFESKVRPVLVEHCYECHSREKTKGGLALDTKQGWEKGGDSGPVIVPGKPEESLLIKAVRYHDKDLAMPPEKKGGKLTEAVIADLVEWVKMGAPDPRISEAKIAGMKADEAKSWWAFQPLPKVNASKSVDDFINAKLAEAKLTPAAPADPRTLIRRMSYDLTGLPPSADEVESFVAESIRNPKSAIQNLTERLLASPQYGVQWGRHWLDVVRYADTAGENTDRPLMHAWRYRNWVFDAFNRDLRYDDFVRQQLAGDLLFDNADAKQRGEGIVATGYLAIARRFGHDIEKDMHLTHEDVIDTLGKNFLGLTTGCARCHDHKYDPITAIDYYALYGIFSSTRFAFPGCEPKGQPRDMVPLIPPSEVDALMKPWKERNAKLEAEKKKQLEATKAAGEALVKLGAASSLVLAESKVGEGASVSFEHRVRVRRGEVVQLAVAPNASHGADSTLIEWRIAETNGAKRPWSVAELVPALMKGNPHLAHDGAAWCFLETTIAPAFLTDKGDSISGNSALKKWSSGDTPSVFVNSADQQVMVWTTLAAQAFFVHPGINRPVAVAWISPLDGEITLSGRVADVHPDGGDGVAFELKHIAAPEYGPALAQLGASFKPLAEPEPMPVIPVAYGVIDAKAQNTRLHLRGDPEKLGDEVPRRWLSILGGEPVPADSGSGRKELGDWIAKSPLAARVMVNRIWEWHFGQGLVRSSNDFGARGEKPTHPELLDWLAAKSVESGFSVKAMHRLILSSDVYQRASAAPNAADPDNRLLAHFPRRRLTAEEMRDSLLTASGQLDLMQAEAHPFPAESTWTFTQHGPFNAVYETTKRSAYLMVQRQRRHPFLSLFDGADPNATTAARQTTTVPTQALYFINDPFFHAQADALAKKLASLPDDDARITEAWRILFQRRPSATEAQRTKSFLASYPADNADKWTAQVRVLMASNEFLHID
ncbi:MAG: PSD1 domain-containing protein [Verrucomicrobiaceae bacterium]|nr:PSD1 domain-containing protein [Verrucomicrobiaceae bacterium]